MRHFAKILTKNFLNIELTSQQEEWVHQEALEFIKETGLQDLDTLVFQLIGNDHMRSAFLTRLKVVTEIQNDSESIAA